MKKITQDVIKNCKAKVQQGKTVQNIISYLFSMDFEEAEAVMRSFGVQGSGTAAQREAAEVIAARSSEVVRNQNGGRKYYGY